MGERSGPRGCTAEPLATTVDAVPDWITPSQLNERGLDDWRILATSLATHFRARVVLRRPRSWSTQSAALVDDDDPHTEIDVRPSGVTVQLRAEMEQGFRSDDAALATAISGAERARWARSPIRGACKTCSSRSTQR